MISTILVLFSSIFYRQDTVLRSSAEGVFHIYWLLHNLFSLALATGLAINVNNKVQNYNCY